MEALNNPDTETPCKSNCSDVSLLGKLTVVEGKMATIKELESTTIMAVIRGLFVTCSVFAYPLICSLFLMVCGMFIAKDLQSITGFCFVDQN